MERGGHSGRFQHHRRSKAEQRPGGKKHQQVDGSRRSDDRGLCKTGIIQAGRGGQERCGLQRHHGKLPDQLQGHAGQRGGRRHKAFRDPQNGGIHAFLTGRPDQRHPNPFAVRHCGRRHHRRAAAAGRYLAGQRRKAADPDPRLRQDVLGAEGHAGKRQHDDRCGLQPAEPDLRCHRREHVRPVQAHLGWQGQLQRAGSGGGSRHQSGRTVLQRHAGSQPDLQRAHVHPEG